MTRRFFREEEKETEHLCEHLCQIGVHAQYTEEGRIDITQSPIEWVWIEKYFVNDNVLCFYSCCVPDSRTLPNIEIHVVRIESFPLFWKILGVRWEPIDNIGIAQALINDPIIKSSVMKLRWFVFAPSIVSSGAWGNYYWKIRCDTNGWVSHPSLEYWLLCETIAKRLLATPLIH